MFSPNIGDNVFQPSVTKKREKSFTQVGARQPFVFTKLHFRTLGYEKLISF